MDGYPFDLGRHHRPASTASPAAQAWFDRGLVWSYGFNHEEAVRCFERAVADDPGFALAHWGIAYASGPNYNKDWDAFDAVDLRASLRLAHDAVTRARELADDAAPVERDLIAALAERFPAGGAAGRLRGLEDRLRGRDGRRPRAPSRRPRRRGAVRRRDDEPHGVAAVGGGDRRAGARAPGRSRSSACWRRRWRCRAGPSTRACCHLHVHLMEMSAHPERALGAADALRTLVPGAGHLLHMPTHIDVLCGDYARVVAGNTAAIAADDAYAAHAGDVGFYQLYRAHDHHFRIYGAMFAAQQQVALEASGALEAMLTEELLRTEVPPMADWLEGFVPMRLHVLVRFGRWDELIASRCPADPELYCDDDRDDPLRARAWRSPRPGRSPRPAPSASGSRRRSSACRSRATCSTTRAATSSRSPARCCDGELAYREGRFDEAFAELRRAIELDDTLPYDEPWGWMQPTRHAYGALLLEQDEVERGGGGLRAPTWGSTRRSAAPASTRGTCGACTATTSA